MTRTPGPTHSRSVNIDPVIRDSTSACTVYIVGRPSPRGKRKACMMATSTGGESDDVVTVRVDVDTELSVLEMGVKFTYRVPSFSVFCADLRQIKYQLTVDNDLVVVCDGFIRADQSLEAKSTPFTIVLKDYCFVPVYKLVRE